MQTHTHNDSCRLQWGWRLNLNRFVIFLFFSFCQQKFLMTVIFYLTTITYNWHGNDELATKEERRHTPVNSTVDNNIIELTVKREHFICIWCTFLVLIAIFQRAVPFIHSIVCSFIVKLEHFTGKWNKKKTTIHFSLLCLWFSILVLHSADLSLYTYYLNSIFMPCGPLEFQVFHSTTLFLSSFIIFQRKVEEEEEEEKELYII